MAQSEQTPSFILELKLKTANQQKKELLKKSDCARQLYNAVLGEALKRLNKIQNTKKYQELIRLPKDTLANRKLRNKGFKELNKEYGFSKIELEKWGTKCKNDSKFINKHLGTHVCQKISNRAFNTVEKLALKKAKKVHFKRKGEFVSLDGKNNETFLRYSNGYALIGNLVLKCLINPKDKLIQYSLSKRVKFCKLIYKKIKGKDEFYIQLVLEGIPYKKYKMGSETTGIDIGPSTIATANDKKATLKVFCGEINFLTKEKRLIQRKMDRSKRATNPQNYNPNGTVKKGRLRWNLSKTYLRMRNQLYETQRKLAATRKTLHGRDANLILIESNSIKAEKLSYKAFQKIFGKSVGNRAPSMFIKLLQRKMDTYGGLFQEIPTQTTKLSQTCHCGLVIKKPLKERWHKCSCGAVAQRDLYSAYLAKHINLDNKLDFNQAKKDWHKVEPILNKCIDDLKNNNLKKISTFGV